MKRKLLSAVLLGLVVFVLTACQRGKDQSDEDSQEESEYFDLWFPVKEEVVVNADVTVHHYIGGTGYQKSYSKTYEYDEFGVQTLVVNYDADGNETGRTVSRPEYDADGKLLRIQYRDSEMDEYVTSQEFEYDDEGRRIGASQYWPLSNADGKTISSWIAYHYQYIYGDGIFRVKDLYYRDSNDATPSESETVYNTKDHEINYNDEYIYYFDEKGNNIRLIMGRNDVSREYTEEGVCIKEVWKGVNDGGVRSLEEKEYDEAEGVWLEYSYRDNANGENVPDSVRKYKYDDKGRMTKQEYYSVNKSGKQTLGEKITYRYDDAGNLLEENRYNSRNELYCSIRYEWKKYRVTMNRIHIQEWENAWERVVQYGKP